MKASDYRREFSAYHDAVERAAYEQFSGRDAGRQFAHARERFADLWTREAVAELERERDESPAGFETERAALSALTNAARLGHAERRALEATDELTACESAARVEWGGVVVGLRGVPALIAAESDAPRRGELAARWLDGLRPCDDLRAARLDALAEAARGLGFSDYGALLAEATRADFDTLKTSADALLERTAPAYAARLARWAAAELPPESVRAPAFADAFRLARLPQLDQFFPARAARRMHDDALDALGVSLGRQPNLRVEELARTRAAHPATTRQDGVPSSLHDADSATPVGEDSAAATTRAGETAATRGGDAGTARAFESAGERGAARCFGLSPPADVRLAYRARAGADFCLRFFQEAGRAQHLAWASRESAARYPEFVRAPDRSVARGFGLLFRQLFTDAAWLAERRGLRASEAAAVVRACALAELHDARRACALLRTQLELYRAGSARSEALAAEYAARQREATGFDAPAGLHLSDALGAGARAAEDLRARLFAAAFAERLRTRHGTRWWASPAAGDELRDVWNTASRHTAEELAWLAAGVRPDPELLAEQLTAALAGGD